MVEKWKQIKNHEKYEVSNFGHFRKKVAFNLYKVILGENRGDGAIVINLSKDGHRNRVPAHTLVAENFLPNPNNAWTVKHKDGNLRNNNVLNLKWCKQGHDAF